MRCVAFLLLLLGHIACLLLVKVAELVTGMLLDACARMRAAFARIRATGHGSATSAEAPKGVCA